MKGFTAIAALAAVSSTLAAPSEKLAARQSTAITPITVKGNGEIPICNT
jgi:hypothetical protein